MIGRCSNKLRPDYERYGARGITVCDRWKDFRNFYADMGTRPHGMSIDRIDNDKMYSPDNCKWATVKQQNRNTRRNIKIEFNGEVNVLKDWATLLGINYGTLHSRYARGDTSPERLFHKGDSLCRRKNL